MTDKEIQLLKKQMEIEARVDKFLENKANKELTDNIANKFGLVLNTKPTLSTKNPDNKKSYENLINQFGTINELEIFDNPDETITKNTERYKSLILKCNDFITGIANNNTENIELEDGVENDYDIEINEPVCFEFITSNTACLNLSIKNTPVYAIDMDDYEPILIEDDISIEVEKDYKILLFKNTEKNIMCVLRKRREIEDKIIKINSAVFKQNREFINLHY